ncbi:MULTISPECIES: hypothetical protein [unclassified Sinorhizobium]|uniref:hypothetical protein n=1 Tax=unclassified Sinorhizobium TaxID=2613772 RepID=UPI003524FDDA
MAKDGRKKEPRTFTAEEARGGEIILRTRWRKIVFIGGLIGLVVLTLLLRFTLASGLHV